MSLDRVDLPLQGLHVCDGGEIQILAPDIGLETLEELLAEGQVAGDGTGLDHGRPLPILTHAFIVDTSRLDRDCDLGGARVGPQPQINPVGVAVRRYFLQKRNETPGQAHKEFCRLRPASGKRRVRIKKYDKIDITRIIELVSAELAHGQHSIPGARTRAAGRGKVELARPGSRQQEVVHGRTNDGIGKVGQFEQHGIDRQSRGQISNGQEQRSARPDLADRAQEFFIARRYADTPRNFSAKVLRDPPRIVFETGLEEHMLPQNQFTEKRRTAKNTFRQVGRIGVGRDAGRSFGGSFSKVGQGAAC